jgi:hypothetical protein
VPTVIYGPVYNPQDGVSAVFSEVQSTTAGVTTTSMHAIVSVSPSAPGPVFVTYLSFANATAHPTPTGGDFNFGNQVLVGTERVEMFPGDTLTFTLPEGPEGTYVDPLNPCDTQPTGDQFDVNVQEASDPNPLDWIGVAGIIAYDPNLPAVASSTLPGVTGVITYDTELPGVTPVTQQGHVHGTVVLP